MVPEVTAETETRRWHVTMADKTTHVVEARGFRVEGGALVMVLPAGSAAAMHPEPR